MSGQLSKDRKSTDIKPGLRKLINFDWDMLP